MSHFGIWRAKYLKELKTGLTDLLEIGHQVSELLKLKVVPKIG